ncbi:Isoprenylcysteine carboxyl methyltransferase (ICMT) family protein [Posidoniimonas polymericola]|uniref:Isoprenylcysteine carboxyl methyltransferase (ICMT) family protein n=1 Tax=Posidoniimonas polymericola TaxID=2528002 RepID=A0A5C5YD74_9BACT|nr:isoprenylcysteine carboxylmethyltransferase family protein [Posidoniimonas polymericola]TWT72733.1 Isoprenylcysteine carboxyl methyltransferase (ICMT) family protein [Posidoniimonas polymericola]
MVDLGAKTVALVLLLAAALFGGAGRLAWPAGWLLIGLYTAFVGLACATVDPDLLRERARPGHNFEHADALLATCGFLLLYPITLAVAGFDAVRLDSVRLGGGAAFFPGAWLVGAGAFAVGYWVALRAMQTNRFFSTFVRIQSDQGHTLVTDGPYAVVRHPGYAGMLLAHFGIPLLLGSWWAFVPVLAGAAVFVVRIMREEAVLSARLPGYDRYLQTHKWRLAPWVW